MKETFSEDSEQMFSAVSSQAVQGFREDFELKLELPRSLTFLDEFSKNYYWSWCEGGTSLFRDLDPDLWESCEQNPRELLSKLREIIVWQKANDRDYLDRIARMRERFENYLATLPPDFDKITSESPVAYFCAEYGVHNSLPIYSGGLGILAGDHLKSASDLNVPLVAVGLMYRFGYFRQQVAHDGWQEENYVDSFEKHLALEPVRDGDGKDIRVEITMRGRRVSARAWLARIGRIPLYLLDTNVPENTEVDRFVTGHLYGGDQETRIVQEKILGIGGVQLLRKLGVTPSVFHLNEGHSAFLNLELAREILAEDESLQFEDVVGDVREQCVFTTHTPVDAGNDSFPPNLIEECFDSEFISSLRLSKQELFALGKTDPEDEEEWFGMTPLAIRLSRSSNGVSEKHGQVSRELWLKMFPEIGSADDVPIRHVTNGVHPATWIAAPFQELYARRIGEDWRSLLVDPAAWQSGIAKITDEDLWDLRNSLRRLLIAFARNRAFTKDTGRERTIHETNEPQLLYGNKALTIGFARRIAGYKRWDLILHDLDRLLSIVNDEERPVQFVFAGKAHPQDSKAKEILRRLLSINHESKWQERASFVEDYDQEIARYLVQGVDVWMNVPRRPYEASGTSGQKVAMNGGLNFSVLDGWWIEGFNGMNGFAIGATHEEELSDEASNDDADAESLYSVLEEQIIPAFYDRDENGLPRRWIAMVRDTLATLTPRFSSDRMVRDYIQEIYMKNSSH